MIKVGLTGGIGSGKTTVAKVFEQLNIPVFYADEESKKLLDRVEVKEALAAQFGPDVFDSDGTVSRKALAQRVFSHAQDLADLNQLLHPRLKETFKKWAELQTGNYVIMEAAILFESGFNCLFDKIVVVSAPETICIQRVMARDKVNTEQVRARMDAQWPLEKKLKKADFVITNDDTRFVIPQIIAIDKELKSFCSIKKQ